MTKPGKVNNRFLKVPPSINLNAHPRISKDQSNLMDSNTCNGPTTARTGGTGSSQAWTGVVGRETESRGLHNVALGELVVLIGGR